MIYINNNEFFELHRCIEESEKAFMELTKQQLGTFLVLCATCRTPIEANATSGQDLANNTHR
jgi:hypothetical protein